MFRDLESIFTENFKNTILFYDENKTITLDDFKNDMCNFLNETKLIEDKTEDVVFIFVSLNLGTHFVCGFPYFVRKLLFIHDALLWKI